MNVKVVTSAEKDAFNAVATHPLQSYEWGEFREKTGIKIIRRGVEEDGKLVDGFQLTIHKIPRTPWNIGYLPKGRLPSREVLEELKKIGESEKCVFIQLEPNVRRDTKILRYKDTKQEEISPNILISQYPNITSSAHPLFTKYTFILDLTKSEDELLKNMHPKTRYNIRVAQKNGVTVQENNSDEAFEEYLKLTWQTTKRQGFYAHTKDYHRKMWQTLSSITVQPSTRLNLRKNGETDQRANQNPTTDNGKPITEKNQLLAHLLTATHQGKILVAWIMFVFHDTLYYPYGASSNESREVMASNVMMWEAIRFGKKLGLKKFDMWGSLGPDASPSDPWYGFHRFKQGYGPELVEFVGSYDLIINPLLYQLYKVSDKLRWVYLKLKK